jgi:hypothetical protein
MTIILIRVKKSVDRFLVVESELLVVLQDHQLRHPQIVELHLALLRPFLHPLAFILKPHQGLLRLTTCNSHQPLRLHYAA